MQNYSIDPELLANFIDESLDSLAPLDQLFVELETNPKNIDIINQIFRPVHSLKGNSAFFGLLKTKELSHKMENILDSIRKGKMTISKNIIKVLLPGLDMLREMLTNVRSGKNELKKK